MGVSPRLLIKIRELPHLTHLIHFAYICCVVYVYMCVMFLCVYYRFINLHGLKQNVGLIAIVQNLKPIQLIDELLLNGVSRVSETNAFAYLLLFCWF